MAWGVWQELSMAMGAQHEHWALWNVGSLPHGAGHPCPTEHGIRVPWRRGTVYYGAWDPCNTVIPVP